MKKKFPDLDSKPSFSNIENEIISSKFVKEIGYLRGDLKKFVSNSVIKAIKDKLE